jgi:hypothetical protein
LAWLSLGNNMTMNPNAPDPEPKNNPRPNYEFEIAKALDMDEDAVVDIPSFGRVITGSGKKFTVRGLRIHRYFTRGWTALFMKPVHGCIGIEFTTGEELTSYLRQDQPNREFQFMYGGI